MIDFGFVIFFHSRKDQDAVPLFEAYFLSVLLPWVKAEKKRLSQAGVDIRAGVYLQMDGEGPLVKALVGNHVRPEMVKAHIHPLVPPGSTSSATAQQDNSFLHSSQHVPPYALGSISLSSSGQRTSPRRASRQSSTG